MCANSGTLCSWCWEGCVGGRRVREWEEQGWREGEAPCLEALLCVPGVLSLEFLMEIRLSVLSVAVLKVLWHLLGDFVNFSETFAPFRRLLLPRLWGLVYTLGHRIRALQTVEQGTPRLRVFRRMTGLHNSRPTFFTFGLSLGVLLNMSGRSLRTKLQIVPSNAGAFHQCVKGSCLWNSLGTDILFTAGD